MTMTQLNGQEVPETPEEEKKPGFFKRHKTGVALSIAGLFVAGAVGSTVTGGQDTPAPEAPVAAQESPKAEEPVQPSPEPVAPSPEPVQEEVQPEPVAPVQPEGPTDGTIGETVPDAPAREYVAADFDLPQQYDDAFVSLVIEEVPFAQYANPEAMVDVAMETCAQLANGYTLADIELVANAVYAPGSGEHDAAIAAIYAGNGFYCPELG